MNMPPFNELGYLPPGTHNATWQEFMERFATTPRRLRLATGLAAALRKLAIAGCQYVIVGGSFVTDKPEPNDFDAGYENFNLNFELLDALFVEDEQSQQEVFGGELKPLVNFEGFLRSDREGRPKGVVALDPSKLISQE